MKPEHIEAIEALAPIAPPCFASRDAWLAFLQAQLAAEGVKTVLLIRNGTAVFNRCLNYCEACTAEFKSEMTSQRRCNPAWLYTPASTRGAA